MGDAGDEGERRDQNVDNVAVWPLYRQFARGFTRRKPHPYLWKDHPCQHGDATDHEIGANEHGHRGEQMERHAWKGHYQSLETTMPHRK